MQTTSMKEYLADPGISSSLLKNILRSPADFKAAQLQQSDETKATIMGTAVHCLLLEPAKFAAMYALQPADWGPKNVGDGKRQWDLFKKLNVGRICLGFDETMLLQRISQAAAEHPPFLALQRQYVENAFFYEDPIYGRLKIKPDILTKDGWVVDVKTTSKDIDDESLAKTIFFMCYHFQAAHYVYVLKKLGFDIKGFIWAFVSMDSPAIHIVMRKASPELIAAGNTDHSHALELLKYCREHNEWPGLDHSVKSISLPTFAERIYTA